MERESFQGGNVRKKKKKGKEKGRKGKKRQWEIKGWNKCKNGEQLRQKGRI
jgi:hypothetical protein